MTPPGHALRPATGLVLAFLLAPCAARADPHLLDAELSGPSDTRSGVLDAHVQVRDASGWSFQLQTNVAGNFYTAETVAFPLQVCVEKGGAVACMSAPVEYGGCNSCHEQPPAGGASGRIAAP